MTPDQAAGLTRLMLRWPQRRHVLAGITDASFLDICESYEIAALALARWAVAAGPNAMIIAEEYRRVLLDLEEELAHIRFRSTMD